jgi:hypothetical protein
MRLRVERSNWRLAVIVFFLVTGVAVGGVVAGFSIFSDSGDGALPAMPTTGDYAPISIVHPQNSAIADPDSRSRQGQDLSTVLSRGAGSHRYRVTVSNVSAIGFINSLSWVPPAGMTIVNVTGSSSGHCELLAARISCDGVNLKPPTCTCRDDGGQIVISFIANSDPGLLAGASRVASATPVLKVIPGYVQSADLPSCAQGQVSTAAKPCSSS